MEETTDTNTMPWPMCARCLQREMCNENRRHNAMHHVLSYCLAQVTRDLEDAFIQGRPFVFPVEIAREALFAADRVNTASAALRRIAYIHALGEPARCRELLDVGNGRGD